VAFVSTPTFDPNGFARGLSVSEYATLQNDIDKPLYDRALRGEYPPGSTIKPLMALAALEYGTTDPKKTRICRGVFQLPGSSHRYRDWKKGVRTVSMHKAIAESCDVYFYDVAVTLGSTGCDFLTGFGLGGETASTAGERSGLVPSKAWKKGAFKRRDLQLVPGRDRDRGYRPGHARDAAAARADGGDIGTRGRSATRRGS
jgi:penicillin-binding protein 2